LEDGKDRWKLEIYQEDSIPLLLNLINIPQQIIDLERTLFPRMCIQFEEEFIENRYRNCTRLILANLLLAAQRNKNLHYSRSESDYRRVYINSNNRNFITMRKVRRVMDQLEELKLIDQFKGFQKNLYKRTDGKRTRIKIRQEFLNYVNLNKTFIPEIKQSNHKKSFIVLKDKNKIIKKYSRRDEGIRQIENDIIKINNKYTNIKITLEIPVKDIMSIPNISNQYNRLINNGTLLASIVSIKGNNNQILMGINTNSNIYLYNTIYLYIHNPSGLCVNHCNNLKKLPVESILVFHLEDTLIKRVFNENFTQGGRFYGPKYQNLNSDIRQYLCIDEERTIELDYNGLHLRILYNGLGLECPENPYGNLKGKLKEIFKVICFIGLNSKNEHSAILAIVQNLRDKFGHLISYEGAKTLLDKFKEMHDPISKFFHRNQGIKLQWADSTLMNRILIRLIDEYNIIGLPVHDSVNNSKKI
jgi:predicted ester cyclase